MNQGLLQYLRCPVTQTLLRFQKIKEFSKTYDGVSVIEVEEGLLFSEAGFVFPIIDGVPRMLIESFYDHALFLKQNLSDYDSVQSNLQERHQSLLDYCIKKNRRTKKSFALEWSLLNREAQDRLWHDEHTALTNVFCSEAGKPQSHFTDKVVIDVGCGHGMMTTKIAELATLAIGAELSNAVEQAYKNNNKLNAWFVQADLEFMPFENSQFDVLYCSGVIHHTADTKKSLLRIEKLLKWSGRICLWLYHPQKSKIHRLFLTIRSVTKKLPLPLTIALLSVSIFPASFLFKKICSAHPPNYREEWIDLLDHFTPEHRHEVEHDVARGWLQELQYQNIAVTTTNSFGFSIAGDKKANTI